MPTPPSSTSTSTSSHRAPLKQTSQKQQEQQDHPQCHSCRKRRIRCDATRPACQKCRDRHISCPGYARQKPLVWLADGGRQNEYIRAEAEEGGVRGGRKKGRPKMLVAPPTTRTAEEGERKKKEEEEQEDAKSREMVLLIRGSVDKGPQYLRFRVPRSLDLWYPETVKEVVSTLKYCITSPHIYIYIYTYLGMYIHRAAI